MHRRGLYFLASFWPDGIMSRILANDLRVRVEVIFIVLEPVPSTARKRL